VILTALAVAAGTLVLGGIAALGLRRLPTLRAQLAGLALLATEAALAVTPWVPRLRRPGTVAAACFHAAAVPLVATTPLVGLRLVIFGGTAVLLHAVSAGMLRVGSAPAGAHARRRAWKGLLSAARR